MLQSIFDKIQITDEEEKVLFDKDDTTPNSEEYEEKILQSLKKLDTLKEFSTAFEGEHSHALAESLKERARYIEDNAYGKLEQFLKLKMREFESLLNNSSFLIFIKITLSLLKERSDYYNHVVKDLVESRK